MPKFQVDTISTWLEKKLLKQKNKNGKALWLAYYQYVVSMADELSVTTQTTQKAR